MKKLIFAAVILSLGPIFLFANNNDNIADLLALRNNIMSEIDAWEDQIKEIETLAEQGQIDMGLAQREIAELQENIRLLQWDLEVALDRIMDAEDGAIALLDQNTELYNMNRDMARLTEDLRRDIAKMEKRNAIQPFVMAGGIGIAAVGGYMIGQDPFSPTGYIVVGADILVYCVGKFIFKWW